MHIVSASRRTDIPAFHGQWFMNRIRGGFARVRSPFGGRLFDVSLLPEDVIAVVLWTKNAAPVLPRLDELARSGHCFTFLYTINGYPGFLEPRVPPVEHSLEVVRELTLRYSPFSFRWRYDTIVLTEELDYRWHLSNFADLCRKLSPYARECIFSFCDYYRKTERNMNRCVPGYEVPSDAQCKEISENMAEIAGRWDISFASCSHDFLVSERVLKARCIDPDFLLRVVDSEDRRNALTRVKSAPSRKECGCAASRDIGAYDTCAHGCIYCYANANPELAARNLARIDADDICLSPGCRESREHA